MFIHIFIVLTGTPLSPIYMCWFPFGSDGLVLPKFHLVVEAPSLCLIEYVLFELENVSSGLKVHSYNSFVCSFYRRAMVLKLTAMNISPCCIVLITCVYV